MTNALHLACLVVGATIFLCKVWVLPFRARDTAAVVFCVYVGLSAASYLFLLPPVYVVIDRWTGLSNSAGMASGVSVLGLTIAQQYLLVHWTYPTNTARRRFRRRLALGLVMIATYVVTFFAFAPRQERFQDFYLAYAHRLFQAPYLVLYTLACLVGQADVVRHCWSYAAISHRTWLRRGMVTTAVGGALILCYAVLRVTDLAAGPLGYDLRGMEPTVWLCGDIGSMLSLIGWVLPTVGERLSSAARWVRAYRTHGHLYPLWRALQDEVPDVALDPPPSRLADRLRLRRIDFWLHRRVIEIHDARRALHAASAGDDRAAPPCMGRGRSALLAVLHRADLRTGFVPVSQDRDFDEEVEWLTGLAKEFHTQLKTAP
ncbi:MAB_1171c family putative transporter [Streptomyces sp. NPDC052040]|uniref:MAB_1171c family putative transporter n=1 Tax=unclassified Streptomyces TaxID=2593676 RepID=UPI0037CE2BF9